MSKSELDFTNSVKIKKYFLKSIGLPFLDEYKTSIGNK